MSDDHLLADHPEDDPDAALVRVEVVVTGSADAVWSAVATGAGIGGWYVPARVEERVGGALVTDHGPFGHARGVVTAYDAPRRFAWEEREWGADVPPWRTEIVVGPAGPGACEVRLTSGLTAEGPVWSSAVAATAEGWAAGLRNLRLAREHFPGAPAGGLLVVRAVRTARTAAWTALLDALGFSGAGPGDEVLAPAGAPPLAGTIEEVGATSMLLRTSSPAPGLVELSAHDFSTPSLMIHAHLFGPGGPMVAEAERVRWDAWLHARFPGARPS